MGPEKSGNAEGKIGEFKTSRKDISEDSELNKHDCIHVSSSPHDFRMDRRILRKMKVEQSDSVGEAEMNANENSVSHLNIDEMYVVENSDVITKVEEDLDYGDIDPLDVRQVTADDNDKSVPILKYECSLCYKRFVHHSSLEEHMIVHRKESKDNPNVCQPCGRRFSNYIALKMHRKYCMSMTVNFNRQFNCFPGSSQPTTGIYVSGQDSETSQNCENVNACVPQKCENVNASVPKKCEKVNASVLSSYIDRLIDKNSALLSVDAQLKDSYPIGQDDSNVDLPNRIRMGGITCDSELNEKDFANESESRGTETMLAKYSSEHSVSRDTFYTSYSYNSDKKSYVIQRHQRIPKKVNPDVCSFCSKIFFKQGDRESHEMLCKSFVSVHSSETDTDFGQTSGCVDTDVNNSCNEGSNLRVNPLSDSPSGAGDSGVDTESNNSRYVGQLESDFTSPQNMNNPPRDEGRENSRASPKTPVKSGLENLSPSSNVNNLDQVINEEDSNATGASCNSSLNVECNPTYSNISVDSNTDAERLHSVSKRTFYKSYSYNSDKKSYVMRRQWRSLPKKVNPYALPILLQQGDRESHEKLGKGFVFVNSSETDTDFGHTIGCVDTDVLNNSCNEDSDLGIDPLSDSPSGAGEGDVDTENNNPLHIRQLESDFTSPQNMNNLPKDEGRVNSNVRAPVKSGICRRLENLSYSANVNDLEQVINEEDSNATEVSCNSSLIVECYQTNSSNSVDSNDRDSEQIRKNVRTVDTSECEQVKKDNVMTHALDAKSSLDGNATVSPGETANLLGNQGKNAIIERHTCEICGNRYALEKSLIRHKVIHCEDNPNICPFCFKRFCSPGDVRRHTLICRKASEMNANSNFSILHGYDTSNDFSCRFPVDISSSDQRITCQNATIASSFCNEECNSKMISGNSSLLSNNVDGETSQSCNPVDTCLNETQYINKENDRQSLEGKSTGETCSVLNKQPLDSETSHGYGIVNPSGSVNVQHESIGMQDDDTCSSLCSKTGYLGDDDASCSSVAAGDNAILSLHDATLQNVCKPMGDEGKGNRSTILNDPPLNLKISQVCGNFTPSPNDRFTSIIECAHESKGSKSTITSGNAAFTVESDQSSSRVTCGNMKADRMKLQQRSHDIVSSIDRLKEVCDTYLMDKSPTSVDEDECEQEWRDVVTTKESNQSSSFYGTGNLKTKEGVNSDYKGGSVTIGFNGNRNRAMQTDEGPNSSYKGRNVNIGLDYTRNLQTNKGLNSSYKGGNVTVNLDGNGIMQTNESPSSGYKEGNVTIGLDYIRNLQTNEGLNGGFKGGIVTIGIDGTGSLLTNESVNKGSSSKKKLMKRYKCDFCPKSYVVNSSLTRHQIIHRVDNPNICPFCCKIFCCPSDVRKHVLVCKKASEVNANYNAIYLKNSVTNRDLSSSLPVRTGDLDQRIVYQGACATSSYCSEGLLENLNSLDQGIICQDTSATTAYCNEFLPVTSAVDEVESTNQENNPHSVKEESIAETLTVSKEQPLGANTFHGHAALSYSVLMNNADKNSGFQYDNTDVAPCNQTGRLEDRTFHSIFSYDPDVDIECVKSELSGQNIGGGNVSLKKNVEVNSSETIANEIRREGHAVICTSEVTKNLQAKQRTGDMCDVLSKPYTYRVEMGADADEYERRREYVGAYGSDDLAFSDGLERGHRHVDTENNITYRNMNISTLGIDSENTNTTIIDQCSENSGLRGNPSTSRIPRDIAQNIVTVASNSSSCTKFQSNTKETIFERVALQFTTDMISHSLYKDTENPEYFDCKKCGKVFPGLIKLLAHMEAFHEGKCNNCHRSFRNSKALYRHEKQQMCSKVTAEKKPKLSSHEDAHSFNCLKCFQSFEDHLSLCRHMNVHNPDSFRCLHCGRKTDSAVKLKKHMKTHKKKLSSSSGKPKNFERGLDYPCSRCDESFTEVAELISHMEVLHECKCHMCQRSFRNFYTLYTHESLQKCSRKTPEEDATLSSRKEAKHFKCLECFETYPDENSLQRHMNLHRPDNPYKCQLCGQNTDSAIMLKKHMKHHKTKLSTNPGDLRLRDTDEGADPTDILNFPITVDGTNAAFNVSDSKANLEVDLVHAFSQNSGQNYRNDDQNGGYDDQNYRRDCVLEKLENNRSDSKENLEVDSVHASSQNSGQNGGYDQNDRKDCVLEKLENNRSLEVTCNICTRSFINHASMYRHWRTHKSATPRSCEQLTCNVCHKRFNSYVILYGHKRIHKIYKPSVQQEKKRAKCIRCGKSFPSYAILRKHQKNLEFCGQKLKVDSQLSGEGASGAPQPNRETSDFVQSTDKPGTLDSRPIEASDEQWVCNDCGKSFSSHAGLLTHTLITHRISRTRRKIKTPPLVPEQENKEKDKPASCRIRCIKCDESFVNYILLRKHQRKSKICGQKTKAADSQLSDVGANGVTKGDHETLKKTLPSKIGKKHRCHICFKSFQHAYSVTRHMNVHRPDNPFRCRICGKDMDSMIPLKRHEETHSKIK